jgi:putative endonuclease
LHSGSHPDISTESDSALAGSDEVAKFDLAPLIYYSYLMNKTSDVLLSSQSPLSDKYYVYTLLSTKDHKFYVGFTTDLKRRISEHTHGLVVSTRLRRPFKLIHYGYFINKADAKARERFLKSGFGRQQMKEALKRTLLVF